jgi:hypothetical protein
MVVDDLCVVAEKPYSLEELVNMGFVLKVVYNGQKCLQHITNKKLIPYEWKM